jgi:DNA polymerase-3 subunit delta'
MNSFSEFRGNEMIVQTLRQALEHDRVPHSLLFSGSEGVGKRTLALMVAKTLNCEQMVHGFCNECSSCKKIEAGAHPDVLMVQVLEDKQFLQIDQLRSAREDVFYQPFEGRCRVIIIDDADRMREDGANSILKMLEEPPPSTKIILLTARFQSLLPTIRSRCQTFHFLPIPLIQIRSFLSEHSGVPPDDLELCARLAQGSLGRALSLDLVEFRHLRSEAIEMIQAAVTAHSAELIMNFADVIGKDKQSFDERLNIFYLVFQDVFYLLHQAPDEIITNTDLLPTLRALAAVIPRVWIHEVFAQLDEITYGLRININRPIALEHFAFRLGALSSKDAAQSNY